MFTGKLTINGRHWLDAVKEGEDCEVLQHVYLGDKHYSTTPSSLEIVSPIIYAFSPFSARISTVFCASVLSTTSIMPKAGDAIVGIASSGVHSNGFSLVRKIFNVNDQNLKTFYPELGTSLGDALLTPTRIYVKAVLDVIVTRLNAALGNALDYFRHLFGHIFPYCDIIQEKQRFCPAADYIVHAHRHYENIPRALPEGISAKIDKDSYEVPAIFGLMQREGNIPEHDMYNT